jgi:threonine dehydrogenase-like Zn-dependent dehydrogenase
VNALVHLGPERLALQDRPEPAITADDQVLIRVRATGICGTDLGIAAGVYAARAGVILGHESAGDVVAVGDAVTAVRTGDRVVVDPTFHCGLCRMCRTARMNHCVAKATTETGVTQDGTFAPLHVTTERFVHRIADHVGYDAASLTEPLSCALTGLRAAEVRPDLRSAVLGAGPMGVLYGAAMRLAGLRPIFIETSPARREMVGSVLGAPAFPSLDHAGELDLIVDTTSVLLPAALGAVSRGGQIIVVGLRRGEARIDPSVLADRSIRLIGSIDSIDTFHQAVHLIESGAIPASALITHRLPLERWADGFQLARDGHALKVVLS